LIFADPDIATDPGVSASSEVSLFLEEWLILIAENHPRRDGGSLAGSSQVIGDCKVSAGGGRIDDRAWAARVRLKVLLLPLIER